MSRPYSAKSFSWSCHCPIRRLIWRGRYDQAQALLNSNASTTGRRYNHTTASVFFDYVCPASGVAATGYSCKGEGRHQVWYDSPGSLAVKMGHLRALGIRGVACWTTGSVDYRAADHHAAAMWDAFAAFQDPRHQKLHAHLPGWKPPDSGRRTLARAAPRSTSWFFRPAEPGESQHDKAARRAGHDGRTYETAWRLTKSIDWSAISPGDTLFVCGLHAGGALSDGALLVSGWAGLQDAPLTIDGSCPHDGTADPATLMSARPLSFPADFAPVAGSAGIYAYSYVNMDTTNLDTRKACFLG